MLVDDGGFGRVPVDLLGKAVLAVGPHGPELSEVSLTLLSDEDIRDLNRQYLGHDRVTDVISFGLDALDGLTGDIYIGYEQAARQAEDEGVTLAEELVRLAVHGTLHVLGWDHPEGPERGESEMYRIQEALVRALMQETPAR